MFDLKEPQRRQDGLLDLVWWNSLSLSERYEFNVSYTEVKCHPDNQIHKSDKLQVVIAPELIDTSVLEEDKEIHKTIFRPNTWDEYIGQNKKKKVGAKTIAGF